MGMLDKLSDAIFGEEANYGEREVTHKIPHDILLGRLGIKGRVKFIQYDWKEKVLKVTIIE